MGDYIELSRRIKAAGLLERQYGYYLWKFFITLAMLIAGFYFLATYQNIWILLLDAAFLAFVFVQFGLLMHDADHLEVFKSQWKNEIMGILCGNLINGMSSGAWTRRHNQHHSTPNVEDMDPDVDIPVLAYSEEQATEKKGIARLIVKYQAFLWFPLLAFQGYRIKINYAIMLFEKIKDSKQKYKFTEIALVGFHYLAYFGLIFYLLDFWKAIVFITVNFALLGLYMGTIFATNHKGMPLMEEKIDFLTMQVVSTRNVRGNIITDFWMGCLNYQIEHHLFPTMPRNNLSKAKKIIEPFCKEAGLEYYETGFFESYKEILQHFHAVSRVIRKPTAQA